MNVYLDVNGVLVDRTGQPAEGVAEFLEWATGEHDVYWLTTLCRGDDCRIAEMLSKIMPEAVGSLEKIRPTEWMRKTDVIDFESDFRWLDDYVRDAERAVLREHGAEDKLIDIDLDAEPDQLLKLIGTF